MGSPVFSERPVGAVNPWKPLADVATVLIVVFVVDAARSLWRRGNRRRAAIIGGSITLFLVAGGIHTALVDAGLIRMPYMISFAFLAIVAAMSFELSDDVVQAAELARQVRADEQRWRSLLENVELAVVGYDPAWLVTCANPFFSRLTGFGADEIRGRHLTALVGASEVEEVWHAARNGPPPHSRWAVRCASGEERTLHWSSVRLRSPDAAVAGVLSVGADITERLRALHDLQQAQRDLEHLSRTNLLGELTSELAHELNQPLAAILSNAQAARRFLAQAPPDIGEFDAILEDIIRDDKRAGEVIHRLRAMLRKGQVAREKLCLNDTIRDVVEIVKGETLAKQVDVRLSLANDLPILEAGRVEMQQVVMNLLLNSIQAMKDTPPDRRVVSIATAANNGAVETTVRDHGCGIAPDTLSDIFDAFVTTRSAGLGMGLTICRRLIEAHGGRIEARNNPGGGATFLFSLPLAGRKGTDPHDRA